MNLPIDPIDRAKAMQEQNPEINRLTNPQMDQLLGHQFPVLDHGFIRVVDYLGDDRAIVQAARISYGQGTKTVQDDEALVRYLMRMKHTSPFEQCEIKLHVKVPMDTWRQWIRHRMANVNEYSTRYSEAIDERQATEPWQWRHQAQGNKQGSGQYLDRKVGEDLSMGEKQLQDHAIQEYRRRLDLGVAREQARKDLPLSTYTEAYWKIDLHNLLHFLELRLDPHAQLEIRQYAQVIEGIVSKWVPWTYRAFHDYRVQAMGLSRPEVLLFREMTMRLVTDLSRGTHDTHDLLGDVDALHRLAANHGMSKRETQEAAGKITHLLCLEPQGDEPRP